MFETATPESVGISSQNVIAFLQTLEKYKLNTHSVLMARGNKIFAEAYYAPFTEQTKHRMYSVSKSFTAIAVGLAEQNGLLSLDDKMIEYFPEYREGKADSLFEETTIRDLLTMRSCVADKTADYWGKPDRVKAYFDLVPNQIPGTNFSYDSTGAFLLGCIVERVTGKPFMEYLKENILEDIGFSKDAYCLISPGGHSHSDSGVMCTSRDLLTFARFVMNGGRWNGKCYINEAFMKAAVSKQTDNDITCTVTGYGNYGYGYLIWKAPKDGFAFVGMANQLVICDPKTDFIFVMTAENMGSEQPARMLIYHELYQSIVEKLAESFSENLQAYSLLKAYCSEQKMIALTCGVDSNIESVISGRMYNLSPNPMGISSVKITIDGDRGEMEYWNEDGCNRIGFGMGHNEFGHFPGKKRIGMTASVYEDGAYACAASAVWCEQSKLHILVRVIDTYMGTLSVVISFADNKISLTMKKFAQRILDGLDGCAYGTC